MGTCSDDVLLKFAVVSASRNGNPRHSPGGARTLMFFVLFCFVFVFVFFFHGHFEQGLK